MLFLLLRSALSTFINDTTIVQITGDNASYELGPGANGVILNLRDGTPILTITAPGPRVAFTLRFDDDDYRATEVSFSFSNVDVTFACDDQIRFKAGELSATNTRFYSTKSMIVEYTGLSDSVMDLSSLENAFGIQGIFSLYLNCTATFRPKIYVPCSNSTLSLTLNTDSFTVTTFSANYSVFDTKTLDIVLQFSDDQEAIVNTQSTSSVRGDLTLYGHGLRVLFDNSFRNITQSQFNISLFCEIVHIPYQTLPPHIFRFIDSNFTERADQVILYDNWMRYCVYDDDTPCDVHGTYPLRVDATQPIHIPALASIAYVLCTSTTPTFLYTNISAPLLSFTGGTCKATVLQFAQGITPTGGLSFDDVTVSFESPSSLNFSLQYFQIGPNTALNPNNLISRVAISQLFNCSDDFYFTQIYSDGGLFYRKWSLASGGTLAVHTLRAFSEVDITNDFVKFTGWPYNFDNTLVNNFLLFYVDIIRFNITGTPSQQTFRGGVTFFMIAANDTNPACIEFDLHTSDLKNGTLGPVQLITYGPNNVLRHHFDVLSTSVVNFTDAAFVAYCLLDAPVCLYFDKDVCQPAVNGFAAQVLPTLSYQIPKGKRYVFTLPHDMADNEINFVFANDSATDLGFVGLSFQRITLNIPSADRLTSLSLENVGLNLTGCQIYQFTNYTDLDSELDFGSSVVQVTKELALTWNRTLDLYVNQKIQYSGQSLVLKSRLGHPSTEELSSVFFSDSGWNLSSELFINRVSHFAIESSSENVVFNCSDSSIYPIEFISFVNSTLKIDLSFATLPSSQFAGATNVSAAATDLSVNLIHPFSYYDSSARAVFSATPPVQVNSYRNCSICLSSDGQSDCDISTSFFLREQYTPNASYVIPPGFRYFVHTSVNNTIFEIANNSANDTSINGHSFTISLLINQPPDNLSLGIEHADVVIANQANLSITLQQLVLVDIRLSSPVYLLFTVTETARIEMDVFDALMHNVFGSGNLKVLGTLHLIDSLDASLESIEFSSSGCTLNVRIVFTVESIQIPQNQFSNIVIGALTEFSSLLRIVNLTVDASTSLLGDLTVRIDSPNQYLAIGPEWSHVNSIANRIVIDVGPDVARGRVIYDSSVSIATFFALSPKIGLIENQTALSCYYGSGDFPGCLASDVDMRPVECVDDVCVVNENRTFVVYGENSFSFVDFVNVSLLFVEGITINLTDAPASLNLTVGAAFGNTDTVVVALGGDGQTLRGLAVTDPVNITVPTKNFVLTVDNFSVDYRSFKRFFKDVGVFVSRASLKVKNQFLLDEETRYSQIVLSSEGWRLFGNENAWNTTLSLGSATLVVPTAMSRFTVSADDYSLRASLSLFLKTPNASVVVDSSVLDVYRYNGNTLTVNAAVSAVLTHSFKYFPVGLIKTGSSVSILYVPLTNVLKRCFWANSPTECTIPDFIPMPASSGIIFEPAASLVLELHGEPTLILLNTSASNITIFGNRKRLWVSFEISEAALNDLQLKVSPDWFVSFGLFLTRFPRFDI
jgi:hypothetical protein